MIPKNTHSNKSTKGLYAYMSDSPLFTLHKRNDFTWRNFSEGPWCQFDVTHHPGFQLVLYLHEGILGQLRSSMRMGGVIVQPKQQSPIQYRAQKRLKN